MKKSFLKYGFFLMGIALVTSSAAHGLGFRAAVPEVDPGLAIGAFTLLAGALAVVGARRKQ